MATPEAATPTVGDSIVASRQLIAQSKRLMLTSLERRARLRGGDELRKRAERIRDETANAHRTYRAAVLTWGQTTSLEFRLIAYSSLAELADSLVVELLDTIGGQSARDKLDLAIEIEGLQVLIGQWRQKGRPALASTAA
jgi:hypothetical protein